MFDTLKLIYTQDEVLELVSRYEKVYNEKIKELEEENRNLKEERDFFKEQAILWRKDWKVAYEEKRKLEDKLESLEK